MFGRRRKDPWAYGSSVPQPFSTQPPSEAGPQGLAGLALIERMPPAAAASLREIDARWREALSFSERAPSVDGATLREFERLVTRDAPDVVSAWLALPAGSRLDDARAADDVLSEQLGVLERAAVELAHRALQPGRDGVAIETSYLESKYRRE